MIHRQIQTPLPNPSPQSTMLQSSHGTPPGPSPARLGLSNPQIPSISSPSLSQNPNPNPNPNPNLNNSNLIPNIPKPSSSSSSSIPPQQQQILQVQPSSSSSTALLSLLPPLPRAQSLLLQMASLASKLFEVSPNRSLWSTSYRGSLPSFLPGSHSHPLSLDPRQPSPPSSAKEVLSLFHTLQTHLFESVADLQEILDLQDSHNKLARDVRAKDSALLSFAKKIKESELVLDRLVDDYADYRDRDLLHPNLDLNQVLAYAHRISYTTFAPPEHGAGLAPLRGALPPAPQDNEMRASQLYHFADLDVGVPKKAAAATAPAVGEGKEGAAGAVVNDVLMEPTPPREEVPAIPPPMLPIAVPPGWRRGMPVELPSDLPPVPPGWKPGDPVPLPPLEGVLAGIKEELPRLPAVQKAPESIQVQHVVLDIYQDSSDDSDGESLDDD